MTKPSFLHITCHSFSSVVILCTTAARVLRPPSPTPDPLIALYTAACLSNEPSILVASARSGLVGVGEGWYSLARM